MALDLLTLQLRVVHEPEFFVCIEPHGTEEPARQPRYYHANCALHSDVAKQMLSRGAVMTESLNRGCVLNKSPCPWAGRLGGVPAP